MSKAEVVLEPKLKRFKLTDLNPAKYNPRTISDDALKGLGASIKMFGIVEPLVVNIRGGRNVIVGGHQRYKVLKKLKAKEFICVTVDLNNKDEKLLNLALNNPEIQGEFVDTLNEYIEKLKKQVKDSTAFVDLRIDELQKQIKSLVVDSNFFDDGVIGGIISDADCESVTFVFTKAQAQIVKSAIRQKTKPEIANMIVEMCEGL